MLDHFEVADLFLERGWITPERVVEGDVQIIESSRRNRNFKVVSEHGPSYFLKHGVGAEKAATLAREAAIYGRLSHDPRWKSFAPYLPHFYEYNPQQNTLLLELLPDSTTFTQYHLRLGRFPVRPALLLGHALSALHSVDVAARPGSEAIDSVAALPFWALSIHHPHLAVLHEASAANMHLVRIIQRFPEFGALLDGLKSGWKAVALIHADIKWDNLIMFSGRHSNYTPAHIPDNGLEAAHKHPTGSRKVLKIVDWEMACPGDPAWDVGSVFSSYLNFWLNSIPFTGMDPPEDLLVLARYPLDRMYPALRTFWRTYTYLLGWDADTTNYQLLRAVRYAAARLVQSAYEDSRTAPELSGNLVCFLQVSLNMLMRPAEAAQHLLGLSVAGAASP